MKKNNQTSILLLSNEQLLKNIIEEILLDLPEWFGIPESTQEYIIKGSKLPTFVAYLHQEAVGFISLKENSNSEIELYVLGVKRKYHRHGIGKTLISKVIQYCIEKRYKSILVMTLDESYVPFDKNYDATRKFYEAVGFIKIKVDNEIWGEYCPCLVLRLELFGGN